MSKKNQKLSKDLLDLKLDESVDHSLGSEALDINFDNLDSSHRPEEEINGDKTALSEPKKENTVRLVPETPENDGKNSPTNE